MPLVAALLVCTARPARADYRIIIHENGFADQTFTGLTSNSLLPNTTGSITFHDYALVVTTQDSAPGTDPTFGGAIISQNTFTVTSSGPGSAPLIVTVIDDTFSNSGFSNPLTVLNSISTTQLTSGSVTAQALYGATNGTATLVTGTSVTLNGPTTAGSASASNAVTNSGGSTFALGNQTTITFTGSGTQKANFTVTTVAVVPAPAGAVLFAAGLPFLGLGGWLRRRKAARPA